jgi:hypothetical protein
MKRPQSAASPLPPDTLAPMCYFCSSQDTMEPFRRPAHVFLLSHLYRPLRWRYCRTCTRHFLTIRRSPASSTWWR